MTCHGSAELALRGDTLACGTSSCGRSRFFACPILSMSWLATAARVIRGLGWTTEGNNDPCLSMSDKNSLQRRPWLSKTNESHAIYVFPWL